MKRRREPHNRAEWSQPHEDKYYAIPLTRRIIKRANFMETESRTVVSRGWGQGQCRVSCIVSVGNGGQVLERNCGDDHTTV